MSDSKAELIAAAQVNAFDGATPGINFDSNFGFKSTPIRSSAGAYVLELKDKHDPNSLVVQVTRNNALPGDIEAQLPDGSHVEISCFSSSSVPTDSPFFITVHLVKD